MKRQRNIAIRSKRIRQLTTDSRSFPNWLHLVSRKQRHIQNKTYSIRLNLVYKPIMSHIGEWKSINLFQGQITLLGKVYFTSSVKASALQKWVHNIHLYDLNRPLLVVVVVLQRLLHLTFLFWWQNFLLIKQYESLNYIMRQSYHDLLTLPLLVLAIKDFPSGISQ